MASLSAVLLCGSANCSQEQSESVKLIPEINNSEPYEDSHSEQPGGVILHPMHPRSVYCVRYFENKKERPQPHHFHYSYCYNCPIYNIVVNFLLCLFYK